MNCSKCQQEFEKEKFYRQANRKSGYSSWCKACHKAAAIEFNRNHPEKRKKLERRGEARWKKAKLSAKNRKKNWELNQKDYEELISDTCFYCSDELGQASETGVGLDRVDSSLGYTYDNCVPCCGVCNSIKNNFLSLDETLVAIQAILTLRKGE